MSSLLIFLTTVSFIFCGLGGLFFFYFILVPDGSGLFFANPLIAALLGGLISGVALAVNNIVCRPERFFLAYAMVFMVCFLLFSFAFPFMITTPSFVKKNYGSPVQPGRFLSLADDSQLYLLSLHKGPVNQFLKRTLYIPADSRPMSVLQEVQYDPLNQRFLFSSPIATTVALKEVSPERSYFRLPPLIESLQQDFFKVYLALKLLCQTDMPRFYLTIFGCCFLFMGLSPLFLFRSRPLVQWVFVFCGIRLMVFFLAFCLWDAPSMISDGGSFTLTEVFQKWITIFLLCLSGTSLFLITILAKPYKLRIP